MRKITVTGRLSVALLATLALKGWELTQAANEFIVNSQFDGLRDFAAPGYERYPQTSYGPVKKGKRGKPVRW
jgi:hypothetical protein